MTDEDRQEAELRADAILEWLHDPKFTVRGALIKAYAAAVEAKRAEIFEIKQHYTGYLNLQLGAERARSEKLIEALRYYANYPDYCAGIDDGVAKKAIAEYECK